MTAVLAHRPVVMTGHRGMVVAGHHLAADAGAQMLQSGGNAMDAAIAAAATLAIAVPFMNGIGGDAISLWCDSSGTVETINGSGRLPAAFDAQALVDDGYTALPATGPLTVSVPGVVAAWGEALERHGTRSLAEVLQPAIDAAERGVPADATSTTFFNGPVYAELCRDHPELAEMFVPPGTCRLGQVLRQPGAARTLRHLAKAGWTAFYSGPLADGWLARARERGVLLSPEDLAAHRTEFQAPLGVPWRGMTLHAAPPNSQGLALVALARLEEDAPGAGAQASGDPVIDPLAYLAQKQAAFAARDRWCADPARADLPADLLEPAALRRLAAEMQGRPPVSGGGDTATLVVADRDGNAVSWVQSLFEEFGSGVTCPDHGLVLHNRARLETLDGDPMRGAQGGMRPFHTLCPAIMTREGGFAMTLATPGDHGQPQSLYQILRRHYEQGLDVQQAVEWPRLRHDTGDTVLLEDRCPEAWDAALTAEGWQVSRVGPWSRLMGGANVISRQPDGLLMGGADPRRSCYAVVG
ncbi:gamma-glutamyltransferase [Psychromarinibacter sp. C21-152]|uniref:Gamma-glutamyltransferase n=1 Tax=Psychromarinibacter sediminicola TaxID=3033385 RepID=A0AAE3T8N2_9RHOB|nr:gamma-glutamyltransferase [Psychromarinibacter sediminicola]MDF0599680.1 gamma-glutamyltransferase [Psychromarinibacter sediminicola]